MSKTIDILKENASLYGNKTANLVLLEQINKKFSSNFLVPDFIGIKDEKIKSFLAKTYPDFVQDWQLFIEEFNSADKTLSESSKTILASIQDKIENAFKDNSIFVTGDIEYPLNFENKSLMVRSTGHEDSDELNNAGGNLSLQSYGDTASLNQAISQVVSSYFSFKSLSQRIYAGDDITQEPFMPVLMQELIGEAVNGFDQEISSGVAFVKNGKVSVNAAFGHNELVVGSSHFAIFVYC